MAGIMIMVGVPVLVALILNAHSILDLMTRFCHYYVGHRESNLVALAIICVLLFFCIPVFEYIILLLFTRITIGLNDYLPDSQLSLAFVVLLALVSYVQYWNRIGLHIVSKVKLALNFYLRQYRWKRFIVDCFFPPGEDQGYISRVMIYLADCVHYFLFGDWKTVVLREFRSRNFPGPQPRVYAQARERFVEELDDFARLNRNNPEPDLGPITSYTVGMIMGTI
ncbi:hypothetical protein F4781DRAFT_443308 [Annulohypoxylon bovei var. microspora]|nr:hypothetical protein F4781DRAFT_443308 [Annulohypoxylon bovei var. microspora]